ncbi:transposase, partial [Asticcacaulis sp. AC402]|uniref:transposase n=1 Tax=Asticcacaulis sp. AC402 TaxID=1282361 RepID=UPI0012DE6843
NLKVVDVRERDPIPGVTPIHWRLLTTHKIDDVVEALKVVDLYRRRWAIEQLFRTLKTQGFDIEGIRIEDEVPRSKLVTAALIAAVNVQQLVHARDGAPDNKPLRPLTDAFDACDMPLLQAFTQKLEGKTDKQKNPHPLGSLAYGAWVCARLGGWTGYYGKPGPAVMLEGWLRFNDAKIGAALNV